MGGLRACVFTQTSALDCREEANFYNDAANVLKKVSTVQAVEQWEKAVGIFSAAGNFQKAGKLLLSIAELYESELLAPKDTKALVWAEVGA